MEGIWGLGCPENHATPKASVLESEQPKAKALQTAGELSTNNKHVPQPAPPQMENLIPWIENDYPGALAQAKIKQKPLMIEMWAAWCHTCLSMRNIVLKNASFKSMADRFVWLALDTENKTNAEVLKRLPVKVWPTFYILSAFDQRVQAVHHGSAAPSAFKAFLKHGLTLYAEALNRKETSKGDEILRLIREGDRAAIAGKHEAAIDAYQKALKDAPTSWERRTELLLALIGTHFAAKQWDNCVNLGLTEAKHMANCSSAVDFLFYATACADELKKNDSRKESLCKMASNKISVLLSHPKTELSVDDRSEALRLLREMHEALGDRAAARRAAEEQRALLDKAVAQAPSKAVAATYNWPRAEVCVFLGKGKEVIPSLKETAEALPQDYDPPYRVAWLYHQTGDQEKALEAAKRALDLAYGPRKVRIYLLLADIHRSRKDEAARLTTLKEALRIYATLPDGQKNRHLKDQIQEAMQAPVKKQK